MGNNFNERSHYQLGSPVAGPPPGPARTAWLREHAAPQQNVSRRCDEEDRREPSVSSIRTQASLRSLPIIESEHAVRRKNRFQKDLSDRIKAAVELSVQRAHQICSTEEEETPEGPVQRGVGALGGETINLNTGGAANLLGTVTCDGIDYDAIHLKRRQNKDLVKRRK